MEIIKDAEKKTYERDANLTKTVADIIERVKTESDAALLSYAEQFDHVTMKSVRIPAEEVRAAYQKIDAETLDAIRYAAAQIRFFAEQQKTCLKDLDIPGRIPGLTLGHRMVPVERCGCYVPAGRHPLPSSALMGIITAKVAGVRQVVACSPAFRGVGSIHPAVLVAMDIAGADEIFCIGGAQAIAALAYGTETVPHVDLIVGPGNRFVTEAKRQVLGDVGIDSLAGPSEVLVLADHTANPRFVAIDLLAQAEHDPNAKPMLVTTDRQLIEPIQKELQALLPQLSTKDVAAQAWADNGSIYLADDLQEAIDITNQIAPEHLEVQVAHATDVAKKLLHYGSMFIGSYAPVAFGDFVSGPNHTLPTMHTARYANGVWVGTFLKTPFHQIITKEACEAMAPACMKFAAVEGLDAHRLSVAMRLEK